MSKQIGMVGSRTFPESDLHLIDDILATFPKDATIYSGGATGVDTYAIEAAQRVGLLTSIIAPDLTNCKAPHDFTKAYYARNQQIVNTIDELYAFTEKDTGGTWDTIKRANKRKIPVQIIRPKTRSLHYRRNHLTKVPGQGPFHIKRVAYGSAAIHMKAWVTGRKWAEFIRLKDEEPKECAAWMIPEFVEFFQHYTHGPIHVLTQAPKSIRHLNKEHPMDYVCKAVSKSLNVPYVPFFEPWDKPYRGKSRTTPPLICTPAVEDWREKVCYILDDICTTSMTLQTCVKRLDEHRIHSHAVVWMRY